MSNNKLKLLTYFLGIALVVGGTLIFGLVLGALFWMLSALGFSPDEQFAWLKPTLIWGVIIIIVAGSTAFVHDMTSFIDRSNLSFLLLWSLTIGAISLIGSVIVGEALLSMDVIYTVAISWLTIAALKKEQAYKNISWYFRK